MQSKQSEYSNSDRGETRNPRQKVTNIIDVFNPRKADLQSIENTSSVDLQPANSSAHGKSAEIRNYMLSGKNSTEILQVLIDHWLGVSPEERPHCKVRINKLVIPYGDLCVNVGALKQAHFGSRVVCGQARIKAWSNDQNRVTHYFIDFIDECKQLPVVLGSRLLTISLPLHKMEAPIGKSLKKAFENSLSLGHNMMMYAWGDVKERTKGIGGYELVISAVESLAYTEAPPVSGQLPLGREG